MKVEITLRVQAYFMGVTLIGLNCQCEGVCHWQEADIDDNP